MNYNEYETYEQTYEPIVYVPQKKSGFGKKFAAVLVATAVFGGSLGAGGAATAFFLNNKYSKNETAANYSESSDYNYVKVANETLGNTSVSSVFKKVTNSVVSINTVAETYTWFGGVSESQSAGSGIIFKEDDEKIYVVTNYHVIKAANAATISLDDETNVEANYVGGDEAADIAVISVKKSALKAAGVTNYKIANFGDSSAIQVGDAVLAVGNALGEGKSATLGIVSMKDKVISSDGVELEVVQTDAAINPGNSGGALVNLAGQVIGINSIKMSGESVEGVGYAIPINNVKTMIDEIMNAGSISRPYLGIENFFEVTAEMQEYYSLPSKGIYVGNVTRNSTAEAAGLQAGDIITAMNGKSTLTEAALIDIIDSTNVGESVELTVTRTTATSRRTYTSKQVKLTSTMKAYVSDTTNF
ncbi:MAG: trypsin-like peptidase domain-containing protein [Clostridiales bacterium]|jgi:serine protease Do|nr:trypsin-like peptidase domain-containing protein [Clostridiales bacterium]